MIAHLILVLHSSLAFAFWLLLPFALIISCSFSGDKTTNKNSDESGQGGIAGYINNKGMSRKQKSKDNTLEQKGKKFLKQFV